MSWGDNVRAGFVIDLSEPAADRGPVPGPLIDITPKLAAELVDDRDGPA
jgi:hypothetical protein